MLYITFSPSLLVFCLPAQHSARIEAPEAAIHERAMPWHVVETETVLVETCIALFSATAPKPVFCLAVQVQLKSACGWIYHNVVCGSNLVLFRST